MGDMPRVLLSITVTSICFLCYVGGGTYNLAKLFHHELVGDVPKEDLKEFLAHLSAGETRNSPGLVRWHERIIDEARFNETFGLCELCTGMWSRAHFTHLRIFADGGFVNDWIRLYDAQLQNKGWQTFKHNIFFLTTSSSAKSQAMTSYSMICQMLTV